MRITINELRKLIREEVDRLVRRSAGFGGGAGLAGRARGSIEHQPIGLGDEEEQQENGKEQQEEKSQFVPSVTSRIGPSGQA